MEVSTFDLLGQQFRDFLSRQFSPPPGTRCVLGFLGAGVAVEPESFLSQGEFNLARVNTWLDIVVEPLGVVGNEDGHVAATSFTALSLMQAVCTQAQTLAEVGSDAQAAFARVKSQAMQSLGGATTVQTAPLDWYDPKHLPEWGKCALSVSNSTASGSSSSTTPLDTVHPLRVSPRMWSWRQLQDVHVVDPSPPPPEAAIPAPAVPQSRSTIVPARAFRLRDASVFATASNSTAVLQPIGVSRLALAAAHQDRSSIPIQFNQSLSSRLRIDRAILVSRELASAADSASSSSVATSSLSLNLSYLVVPLSREPWWSEMLLLLDNWYIPSLSRGALVAESDAGQSIGVPIALVLTANVQIQANWSATDRAAASTNTHLGPWALHAAQFGEASTTGQATLTIAGMQAVACIYRTLPMLPPKAQPT